MGHPPLPPLLVPLRIVHDCLQLVLRHQNTNNGRKLLYLLLLVTDGVQQLLLLLLVLVLDVLQLDQVGSVLLLDLLETRTHLVHLLVQILVVLLNTEQLPLPALLLPPELLLLLLLLLQLLLQFFNLLHLTLILIIRPLPLKIPLQIF
jgi:hypothetical protein